MDASHAKKSKSMQSLSHNTCCQLFVTDKGYVFVWPLEKESDVLLCLKIFDKDIGVPEALFIDGAKAESSSEVNRFFINLGDALNMLEQVRHGLTLRSYVLECIIQPYKKIW